MFMIYEYRWELDSITTTNGFRVIVDGRIELETLFLHKCVKTYIAAQERRVKASIELQKVELCNNDNGHLFNLGVYFTSSYYDTGTYIARNARDTIRQHLDMMRDPQIDLLRYRFIKPLSRFIVEGFYSPLEIQPRKASIVNVNWSTEGF